MLTGIQRSRLRAAQARQIWAALALLHFGSASLTAAIPLAQFNFATNASDAIHPTLQAELKNTEFRDGSLFLNGHYEFGGVRSGYRAVAPITGLSYETFTVSLDFQPLDFNSGTHTNRLRDRMNALTGGWWNHWFGQNGDNHANILTGGVSYRWLGFEHRDGHLQLTLNNHAFRHVFTNTTVSLNQWHRLVCAVSLPQRRVTTFLDGVALEAVQLPADFQLEVIGSPQEATDKVFTFANYSIGAAFHGCVTRLEVWDRALDAQEIAALPKASLPARTTAPNELNRSRWPWLWLLPIAGVTCVALRRHLRRR